MGIIRRLPAALLLSLFALRNTLASACSPGQYKSTANNAKTCLVCPPGSVTNTLNASNGTTCTPCAPGLYSNDSTVPCASCAPGKYSSLSAERRPAPAQWNYGSGLVARYTVPARPRIVDGNARGLIGTPGPALVAINGMNDAKRWTTARIKGQEVNVLRFAGDGYLKGAGQTLPSGRAARTLAGWFKPVLGGGNGLFGWGKGGCNNAYWAYISGRTRLELDHWCQTEGINPIMTNMAARWYHLVITWDGTYNTAYIDGQRTKRGKPDKPPATVKDGSHMVLGGNPGFSGDYKGEIAEVSVWNRAISAAEVTKLYNNGPFRSDNVGQQNCSSCPPGSVTNTLNAPNGTTCTACGLGLYSNDSTVPCASCAPGKYSGEFCCLCGREDLIL